MKRNTKPRLPRLPGSHAPSASTLKQHAERADEYVAARLKRGAKSPFHRAKKLGQVLTADFVVPLVLAELARHTSLSGRLVVEPSAGDGAFRAWLPSNSLFIEVDTQDPQIIRADFLSAEIEHDGPIAFVGNPPFKAAKAFFNHAAAEIERIGRGVTGSGSITFILPMSFTRDTVIRHLNRNLHLLGQIELPKDAFVCSGKPCHFAAVVQVWEYRDYPRQDPPWTTTHEYFSFGPAKGANFAIQRVGTAAGRTHLDLLRSRGAHLFVHVRDPKMAGYVRAVIDRLPLNQVAGNSTSKPSIAPSQIVAMFTEMDLSLRRQCTQVYPRVGGASFSLECTRRKQSRRRRRRAAASIEPGSQCVASYSWGYDRSCTWRIQEGGA